MKTRKYFKIVFLIFFIGIAHNCFLKPVIATPVEKKIFLVGSNSTKQSFHGKYVELLYTEVFKRMGYQLTYEGYPAKRASHMSDSGEADGEIHRVFDYGEAHSNLIRVEEAHNSIFFVAYGTDLNIQIDGWQSLKNTDFMIGYRRGVKKCESELPRVTQDHQLMKAATARQGLDQIFRGRTKIFIGIKRNIEEAVKSDTVKYQNFHQTGMMEETTVHLFLNKRMKALAPEIAATLRQLKEEGLTDKYKAMAEEK
jgi:polar amino acid transport system substrate-binding protein